MFEIFQESLQLILRGTMSAIVCVFYYHNLKYLITLYSLAARGLATENTYGDTYTETKK